MSVFEFIAGVIVAIWPVAVVAWLVMLTWAVLWMFLVVERINTPERADGLKTLLDDLERDFPDEGEPC